MFSFLEDNIVDYIVKTLKELYTGSSFTSLAKQAKKDPAEFNPYLWKIVINFNKNAVLPVAWSILTLFLLLELASVIKRADARGIDLVYWIMMIILRIAIAKFIMDNMTDIIRMWFQLCSVIIDKGKLTVGKTSSLGTIEQTKISDAVNDLNTLEMLSLWLQCGLIRLAFKICGMIAELLVNLRFIEIYVFASIGAIPFATLVNHEFSSIGKDYIKRFAALALHAVFIIVVLVCYTALIKEGTIVTTSGGSFDVSTNLFSALGYTILCVIALFQTGSWAKSLMGVH